MTMSNTKHELSIKMLLDSLKNRGYLGACDIEKARHIVELFNAGSLRGVSSLRFIGGSKDLPIGVLDDMMSTVLARISAFRVVAAEVATKYGVPEDSAEIFAEDMTVLVLGGGTLGWRYGTTMDVFRHLHSLYRPQEYLIGKDLQNKCTDAKYAREMIDTIYGITFRWV